MAASVRVFLMAFFAVIVGCHKRVEIPPPPIEVDVFSIQHLEFGLERFNIEKAQFNLYQEEGGEWEFVVRISGGPAITRSKQLKEIIHAEPHFEATAVLSEDDLNLVPGKVIVQSEGYDYLRDENLSNLYYFTHESIEELEIELIQVADEWIDARLTGRAIINGSNGIKPDSKIALHTRFQRNRTLKRGIW